MTGRSLASVGAVLLLALLVLLASTGPIGTAAAIVVAAGCTATAALGAERFGTLLLMLALVTAPMNSVRPIQSADLVTFSDLFLVGGFALLVPQLLSRRIRVPSLLLIGALLMTVFWTLASVASADTVTSLGYLVRMLSASTFLPVAFLAWRPARAMVDRLAWCYIGGQFLSTVIGAALGHVGDSRDYGLTTHPNFYGMCGALATALSLFLLHRAPQGRRWLPVLALVVSAGSVLLSGSRAALLAVALLALAYPLLERSARAGYLLLLGAAGVVALANAALLPALGAGSAISRLSGAGSAQGSDDERSHNLHVALQQVVHHPLLGNGFTFETSLSHNGYVEILQAAGLFGLIGYLMILAALVRPLLRASARNRLAYAPLAYIVISTFNNTLWDRFAWTALLLPLLYDAAPEDVTAPEAALPLTTPAVRAAQPQGALR
ncbi:MAG: O-antigen ligase family protein [Marmoricola sp.]